MTTSRTNDFVSRRIAVTGLAAGGLGLALATRAGVSAQETTPDAMANHPIVGSWFAFVSPAPGEPAFASPGIYTPDGYVVLGWPVTQAGPQGVTFHSGWVGSWEPVDDRGIHFTAVQVLSDATGTYLGTLTVDGHPRVGDDLQHFVDDSPETHITVRDPVGTIVTVIPGSGGVTGTRMGVGSDGFPPATPEAGTPTP
jgi:hypothetical protein